MSVRSLQLVWDEHLSSIGKLFEKLYEDELLVDVTISCKDGSIKAHKLILSASSPYFHKVFNENPCKHPTLIMRGANYMDMRKLIEYMYKGTIDVALERVNSIIQLALDLEIKGFEKYNFNASQVENITEYLHNQEEVSNSLRIIEKERKSIFKIFQIPESQD